MKKFAALILSAICILATSGCKTPSAPAETGNANFPSSKETVSASSGSETMDSKESGKMLVAYFSATGTTRTLAEGVADVLDADLYEIVPETPYTLEDLDYSDPSSRSQVEQNDPSARPAISGEVGKMEDCGILFLGYPIWNGQAPRIISTFLESYDFSGKIIVPFCTSGSSGIGSSSTNIQGLAADADWLPGRRFADGSSQAEIEEWIKSLNLPVENRQPDSLPDKESSRVQPSAPTSPQSESTEKEAAQMKWTVQVDGQTFTATPENNDAAEALTEMMREAPVVIQMSDYSGFEKVGPLGLSLPTSNSQTTTLAGDIVLYQGNQVVIFYGSNSWSYTRLGRIEDLTGWEEALGSGDVTVTFSMGG